MDRPKKIVLTRAEEKNKQLITKWGSLSTANFISLPLIQKIPLSFTFDPAIHYDWLFFTSASAVEFFYQTAVSLNGKPKIAVIGTKTAEALQKCKMTIDFIPTQFETNCFIQEWFQKKGKISQTILFPQSRIGRTDISHELTLLGHKVDVIAVYDTIPILIGQSTIRHLIETEKQLIITVASPSAWRALRKPLAYAKSKSIELASIGPVTTEVIQKDGFQVAYQPPTFTMDELIKLILKECKMNE